MNKVDLSAAFFRGAVSLEQRKDGVKPWRIPYQDFDLFPPNGIDSKAEICAGVRVCFQTDSSVVKLDFTPTAGESRLDCLVNGRLSASSVVETGGTEVTFRLDAGWKEIELYLPQTIGMTISGLWIDPRAEVTAVPGRQAKWVTYGSSITQCAGAYSPSRTWPALAARAGSLDLTCLGFSGNCHLEPMVARLIRDISADFISLAVGINVYGAASLSPRTFQPALIGMLATIREKHADTPLLVISPLYAARREVNDNPLGFNLPMMREIIQQTVELLRVRGDRHLYYMSGLDLLSEADARYLPDDLHPDGEGYELIGSRFVDRVILPFREKGIIAPRSL